MGKRKYFILSLLLILCALCTDSVSKSYLSKSTYLLAKSLSMSEADKIQVKIERDELLRKGSIFYYFGISAAILSFLFWIASEIRHEPTWRLIPLGLLIFYLLLQFIMV